MGEKAGAALALIPGATVEDIENLRRDRHCFSQSMAAAAMADQRKNFSIRLKRSGEMFNFERAEAFITMTPLPAALCPGVDAGFWETVFVLLAFYWPVVATIVLMVVGTTLVAFRRRREIESLNLRGDQTVKEEQ